MSVKPSTIAVSSSDLARLLTCTDRTVRRLAKEGLLPRMTNGRNAKFDAVVCVPAYIRYVRNGESGSTTIAQARLKLAEAQRREIELRTRRAERQLLPLDEVASAFEAAMVTVGTQLDGLAGRMAGELATLTDPATIRLRLFDECRRIRNAAATQLEAMAGDPPRNEGAESATAEDA